MQKRIKIVLMAVPVLVVIVLAAAILLFTGGGPDPAQFEHLKQPQVRAMPEQPSNDSGLRAELATWQYGQVAEILHVGPYAREEPTIRRLMDFIRDSGYAITGEHEEEYIKGPGIFSRGDPRSISQSSGTG